MHSQALCANVQQMLLPTWVGFGGLAAFTQESFPRVYPIKIPVAKQCWLSSLSGAPGPLQPLVVSVELLEGRCGYRHSNRNAQGHCCLCASPYSNHGFKDSWSVTPFTRAEGGDADRRVFFHSQECFSLCSSPAFPSATTSLHSLPIEASCFFIVFNHFLALSEASPTTLHLLHQVVKVCASQGYKPLPSL